MTRLLQTIWILPIILTKASFCLATLNVIYEWKYIDYQWKNDQQKADAIAEGTYNYTRIIPSDVQPLPDGRVLVTCPQYYLNPATLSTISADTCDGGPLLAPYPDWSWHDRSDCSGMISINKMIMDEYHRLWVVDSGKIGNAQVCSPKILVFDLKTDKLIKKISIPSELSHNPIDKSRGRLEILAVETSEDLNSTWVYMADVEGCGLLICHESRIWRIDADVFNPDPEHTIFTIAGMNFTVSSGLSSAAITPDGYLQKPALIFKPMASVKGYGVSLKDLHNSKSGSNITFYRTNITAPNQELARAYSKKGGILISGFASGVITCWNLQYPLEKKYIAHLDANETNLQFISSVKITADSSSEGQTVWVLSNKLENFMLNIMDWNSTNYRIMIDDLDKVVRGTVCEPLKEFEIKTGIEDKQYLYYETISSSAFKND